MHALPFVIALASGAIPAPALLRALSEGAHRRPNYSDRLLPFPFGVLILAAALLALIPLMLVQQLTSTAPQRGWRGHGAALLRGELSTGALKAAGSLGLALLAMSYLGLSNGRWLLAAGVLVLATNVFNLLDLRPGRSMKALVLLGVGLTAGSGEMRPLWTLGLFAAPALVAGFYDLRERAM